MVKSQEIFSVGISKEMIGLHRGIDTESGDSRLVFCWFRKVTVLKAVTGVAVSIHGN